jgi:hypothetical protein
MRTSFIPIMHCQKMAVTDMSFRHCAVIEFLVKEGNSVEVIYERLRSVYGDVCMGVSSVRRWVKHFKDGNTDIANQPRSVPGRFTPRVRAPGTHWLGGWAEAPEPFRMRW